jgi:hypothetical protein
VEVKLSRRVLQQLDELPRQRRGSLALRLREQANRRRDGLLTVSTPHDVAACVASSEAGVLLVYAVVTWREMWELVCGAEIEARYRAHAARQSLRGI